MIGWHITKGYETGYTPRGDSDWKRIQEFAVAVASIKELIDEAINFAPDSLHSKIGEVAATYKSDVGNPLHIGADEIMILASGGGEYRAAKEHVARAFVRILMRAVHERGFDISVSVS